jgi:peroxiredoxin
MKNLLSTIALAIIMVSCNQTKNGYTISGTANGMENGKKVFIQVMDENNAPTSIDTAVVTNGKFEFKGDIKEVDLAYIKFDMDGSMPFFLEEGTITVNYVKDSVHKSTVSGTYNNDLLLEFNKKSNEVGEKLVQFQKENLAKMREAQQNQDTVTINAIMEKNDAFQKELNTFSEDFVSKNNNAILSALLVENFINQKALEVSKIQTYFNGLTDNVKNSKSGQRVKKLLDAITSVEIGKKAPDFSAPSPDGKTISLKESLGKVTIIDFWASWCGPCRMENPNVVAMYNELHEKGLNIIGVSLDKDAAKWKDAIEKDGLTWNHISNLKFWQDPIAEMYNVKAIPATFILDANGVIIAKDLRGAELKAKVEELLNK